MSYTTVLVGTDGSESSLLAVDRAAEVAAASSALLIVVCAYTPMTAQEQATASLPLGDVRLTHVHGNAAAQHALSAATARAGAAGASGVTGVLVEDDPAEALLAVAQQRSAELIVVGNRGINTWSGRLLGSVPSDVAHRAPCDVLIVHTTAGRS